MTEKVQACSLPGVHRPLGAGAPGGLHPRPTACHQRWRCRLPLGFPGSACGEVTPSRVSARCWAVPSPASPYLPCPVLSQCNAGLLAFPGLVPPSPLCCREQVSLPPPMSCAGRQVGSSSTAALHGRGQGLGGFGSLQTKEVGESDSGGLTS